ncbi:hypothetical protein FF38_06453 [Lucilia cuprina]|uniref:Uncharacterized protein n=1 Tax=Lucilia cuprina TaxID=7375 RepID=A0A0L0CPI7_LUCCU|nr:hypothetical protein FF38_06453 [Lucilia cuprina]
MKFVIIFGCLLLAAFFSQTYGYVTDNLPMPPTPSQYTGPPTFVPTTTRKNTTTTTTEAPQKPPCGANDLGNYQGGCDESVPVIVLPKGRHILEQFRKIQGYFVLNRGDAKGCLLLLLVTNEITVTQNNNNVDDDDYNNDLDDDDGYVDNTRIHFAKVWKALRGRELGNNTGPVCKSFTEKLVQNVADIAKKEVANDDEALLSIFIPLCLIKVSKAFAFEFKLSFVASLAVSHIPSLLQEMAFDLICVLVLEYAFGFRLI